MPRRKAVRNKSRKISRGGVPRSKASNPLVFSENSFRKTLLSQDPRNVTKELFFQSAKTSVFGLDKVLLKNKIIEIDRKSRYGYFIKTGKRLKGIKQRANRSLSIRAEFKVGKETHEAHILLPSKKFTWGYDLRFGLFRLAQQFNFLKGEGSESAWLVLAGNKHKYLSGTLKRSAARTASVKLWIESVKLTKVTKIKLSKRARLREKQEEKLEREIQARQRRLKKLRSKKKK